MPIKMLTWPGMTSSRAAIYSPPPQLQPTDPKFNLFPSLPTELRLKIWSYAIADIPQRIIPTHHLTRTSKSDTTSNSTTNSRIQSLSFLHTNSESRYETQRKYSRLETFSDNKYIQYLNPQKDILYLNNNLGLLANATMYPSLLKPINHLAISLKQLSPLWITFGQLDLWNLLRIYTPELEVLYIVVGERKGGREMEMVFLGVGEEEAFLEYCEGEEKRGLVEIGTGFRGLREAGELVGLRLRWVREGVRGEERRGLRVGAWGSLDLMDW